MGRATVVGAGVRENGVLEDERRLGAALPEAHEEHQEESCLGDEKHGPDMRLGEHVHRGAAGEERRSGSQQCEKKKGNPSAE
jgi:hypothetical protein